MGIIHTPFATRRYSVRECGRLQTFTEEEITNIINSGVSNSQIYKAFGNGWTIEAILEILSPLSTEFNNIQ